MWGTPFSAILRSGRAPFRGIATATLCKVWGTPSTSLCVPVPPRSKPTSARNAPGPRRLRGGRATGGALATAAMSDPFPFSWSLPLGEGGDFIGLRLGYPQGACAASAYRRTGEQGNVMECLLWGAGAKPRVCGEGKSAQYFCGQVQCRDCCCLGGCVLGFPCLIFR